MNETLKLRIQSTKQVCHDFATQIDKNYKLMHLDMRKGKKFLRTNIVTKKLK